MKFLKKIRLKDIVCFITSTFLMILLVTFSISSFIRFVVINPDSYLNILHKNNTEEKIYEVIQGNLSYALVVSNLPKELADDIISEEEVKYQCDNQFKSMVTYLKTGEREIETVDIEVYLKRFDEKLKAYIKENSIREDNKLKSDLKVLRASLGQIIRNGVEIISSDILKNSSTINKTALSISLFNSNIYYLFYLGIAVLVLSIVFLNHKDIQRGIKWVSCSFISAGSLLTLVFLSGLTSKFYENVIIYTPYLKEFVSAVVREDIIWLLISGATILMLGIITYIILGVLFNKKEKLEVE